MECPRCNGGCSIVCCALCGGSGEINKKTADAYEALGDRYVRPDEAKECRK